MRPRYETAADRVREERVADIFRSTGLVDMVKLPDTAHADYALKINGVTQAVVEVKCRNNPMERYDTFFISEAKVLGLMDWAQQGVRPLLAVQWTDYTGMLELPVNYTVSVGGRADRNDRYDQERMAHFDVSLFRTIKPVGDR